MTIKRTYVLALNHTHFRKWCEHRGYNPRDPSIYYVKDFSSLYGLAYGDYKIIKVPGWERRQDVQQLLLTINALKRANGTKVKKMEDGLGLFTWKFWKNTLERMLKTFAVSILSLTGADGTHILNSSIGDKLIVAAGASVISMLISIIGSGVGDSTDPSFLK